MGKSSSVASFLRAVEQIRQIGDSSDIALTVIVLDLIERNIPVMQDYLDDDSASEIYEDMPVGAVLEAIMSVMKLDTLLMAERIPEFAAAKALLNQKIAMLQSRLK
jgi:hypothetical protein